MRRGRWRARIGEDGTHWAVERAADSRNVGVYFLSSCPYDPSVFLSGLCHELAEATETAFSKGATLRRWTVRLGAAALATGALGAALATLRYLDLPALRSYLGPLAVRDLPVERLIALLLFSALGFACLYITVRVSLGKLLARDSHCKVYAHAAKVKTWTEFSKVATSASELAFEAGKSIGAKGRRTEELSLSERPVTELALLTEFTRLVLEVRAKKKGVLIAIDGLDRIDAVDEVRGLLRRIKGVFDAGALILVAVSGGTVAQLRLRDPLGHDEIRNSFRKVRTIPPLERDQINPVIETALIARTRRGASVTASTVGPRCDTLPEALWVLTGGNPRECEELCERIFGKDASSLGRIIELDRIIEEATELDKAAFVEALGSDSVVGEQQRSSAFAWAHEHLFPGTLDDVTKIGRTGSERGVAAVLVRRAETAALGPRRPSPKRHKRRRSDTQVKLSLLRDAWTPAWAGDERLWPDMVAERWRCLLVRDILRSVLREEREPANLYAHNALNNSFYWSHYSPGIALRAARVDILTDLFNDLYPAATECRALQRSSLRARFRGGAGEGTSSHSPCSSSVSV